MKRLGQVILILTLLGILAAPGQLAAAQGRPTSGPTAPWGFGVPLPFRFHGTAVSARPPRPGISGATIPVGGNPVFVAVDDATHTEYVTNGNDGTVSVVDTTHCRAGDTSGCQHHWPTFSAVGPVAVNQVTHTVYAVGAAGNTISVMDGATCNAPVHTGRGAILATVPVAWTRS